MRRLAAALLVASLALLVAAAGARSEPKPFDGSVWIGANGWGSVKAAKGTFGRPTVLCANVPCPAVNYPLKVPDAVLTEKPYKGWKFNGWRGACKSRKSPRCVLDATRARKDIFGGHSVHATAQFVPVAPGLTRAHPLPLGATANIGEGLLVRVNSASANVQLGTPPPAGREYFEANLTVTYTGTGSRGANWFGFTAVGSQKTRYNTVDGNDCASPGPQPPLDTLDPLFTAQATTGYVCWTIAANDESSLELYFGSGTLAAPRTTWFALH